MANQTLKPKGVGEWVWILGDSKPPSHQLGVWERSELPAVRLRQLPRVLIHFEHCCKISNHPTWTI